MSQGTFFGLLTLLLMLLFAGIWTWAWSRKRRSSFDRAAKMPLENDAAPSSTKSRNQS
jgi:cytochrome c oxidase cbb3-type subunit 4